MATLPLIDLHSHVLPGVDDGAQDLPQALDALGDLEAQGVTRVVATPHFRASLLEQPARAAARLGQFDEAYRDLSEALRTSDLSITLGRACEFKLDAPVADLSDPRLRLDGTRFALVEFGSFQLPPFAGNQLRAIRDAGWTPVLAHPERYFGVERAFERAARWVSEGTLLQVNARSLSGGYGPMARQVAAELLARGWVTCVAGDHHARGRPEWPAALELLRTAGSPDGTTSGPGGVDPATESWIRGLVFGNPERLLADEVPLALDGRAVHLDSVAASRRRGR
ncbi:MAG: tyrosine-protein phosphatase [Gemmatimonadota bacterium]